MRGRVGAVSGDSASGNGTFDCEDDTSGNATAGTSDTWRNDQGITQTPAGLCRH